MKFFLPKQLIFFDLLKQLNNYLKEIALLFGEFADSFNNFEEYSRRAKEIEHQADQKTHEIVDRLNKTFITPFDREDIYLLVHELDDIIDLIENAIHNIEIYQIKEKIKAIDDFAMLIKEASNNLDELIEHLQGQKYTPQLNNLIVKIHELEDRGDLAFQESIGQLFREEKNPLTVIKWRDLLINLERVMDKYQSVSNTIEGIIVKAS